MRPEGNVAKELQPIWPLSEKELVLSDMSRGEPAIDDTVRAAVPRKARILVAVSGGVDSVVLLHSLKKLESSLQLHLEVAHIDHALRASSKTDATFVRKLTRQLGLTYHSKTLRPPKDNAGIEAWARAARYAFLEAVRKKRRLGFICTAHHGGDAAETFLMRLLQNREAGVIDADSSERHLLRPLLLVSKEQILDAAKRHRYDFCQDPTNKDVAFTRNMLRHEVLPFMAVKLKLPVVANLARRSVVWASDRDSLRELAQRAWGKRLPKAKSMSLSELTSILTAAPQGLRWRMIEEWWLPILRYRLGFERATQVLRVIQGDISAVNLPNDMVIRRQGHYIKLQRQ